MHKTRLYLITPPQLEDLHDFTGELGVVLGAAEGSVAAVQLRLKNIAEAEILHAAERLLPVCHQAGCVLLINDSPSLCQKAGADGVHIGQQDFDCTAARDLLGPDKTIGVTCHNSRHLGLVAGEEGADYVAFGAFYPTPTKDVIHHAEPELLSWWRHATTLPCVAIGGITPENAAPLIAAGADFLAVSGAIWQAEVGPKTAIRGFLPALRADRKDPVGIKKL